MARVQRVGRHGDQRRAGRDDAQPAPHAANPNPNPNPNPDPNSNPNPKPDPNPNQIDRNALTQLLAAHQRGDDGTAAAAAARGAPRGALEEVVASSWREVLGVRSVGRGADFLRLGGDSIKALQVS